MKKQEYLYSKIADLPTRHGYFKLQSVKDLKGSEHAILIKGNIENRENVPVRIHSECLTGDAFSSLKCDCKYQLNYAMQYISMLGYGMIIYLRQEGRGIGLYNKVNAYSLQDIGRDTIEANFELGLENDLREYSLAVNIIKKMKLRSINLLTNNPDKIQFLTNHGVIISDRVSVIVKANEYNDHYLKVKKNQLSHLL